MGFYTASMLSYWLKDKVICSHSGSVRSVCAGGIQLLDENAQLDPEYLYVGESEIAAARMKKEIFPDGLFVITAGALKEDERRLIPETVTVIETNLSFIPLYNIIQQKIHKFWNWDASLGKVIYQGLGLQTMLNLASEYISATIILVSAGFKHMAAYYDPDVSEPTADELKNKGYLSFETIKKIYEEENLRANKTGDRFEYISKESGNYTYVYLIKNNDNMAARLCIILNGSEPNLCFRDLGIILSEYVTEYHLSNHGVEYRRNADLGILVSDLIEQRLTDTEELKERIKQIKLATHRFYQPMVIQFEKSPSGKDIPWNYIIGQLQYIFPFSDITTYDGNILLLIRKQKRGLKLSFDNKKLLYILDTYNGYAAIGNTSEFLTSLPPVYHQVMDALRLAIVMNPKEKILYYEEYSMYQMVEMAAETYYDRIGSRNLVHLCNNEFVALVFYDKDHGTNLVEDLYAYLINERNTAGTARSLYVHRNTMLHKVQKIESIIGTTLDDPALRQRLIFSHYVYEYVTKYLKGDFLELRTSNTKRS